MLVATLTPPQPVLPAPVRRPGKRKKIGALEFISGHQMRLLGYCPSCDGKILMETEEFKTYMAGLSHRYKRRGLVQRLAEGYIRRHS